MNYYIEAPLETNPSKDWRLGPFTRTEVFETALDLAWNDIAVRIVPPSGSGLPEARQLMREWARLRAA